VYGITDDPFLVFVTTPSRCWALRALYFVLKDCFQTACAPGVRPGVIWPSSASSWCCTGHTTSGLEFLRYPRCSRWESSCGPRGGRPPQACTRLEAAPTVATSRRRSRSRPGTEQDLRDGGARRAGDVVSDPVSMLLIADTHVPKRARDLPASCGLRSRRPTWWYHAGDWVAPALLDELERRSARWWASSATTTARSCVGACQRSPGWRSEGLRIALSTRRCGAWPRRTLRQGLPGRRRAGLRSQPHPVGPPRRTGLRLLNPGSPTDRRRQPWCTYMTASVSGGALADVVLHRLPHRDGTASTLRTPDLAGPCRSQASMRRARRISADSGKGRRTPVEEGR
jgi:predicted phosphodiesterase